MQKKDDLGDMLIEEVLSESASDFFGKRKKIEDQIDILQTYAHELQKQSRIICKHLSFLSYLLLGRHNTKDFFHSIGVSDCESLLKEKHPFFEILPEQVKLGFRLKTQFTNLVFLVYSQIQNLCEVYLYGRLSEYGSQDHQSREQESAGFYLVTNMVEVVNENIRKVNRGNRPSTVLQFARSLNPETALKEKITGSMSSAYNQNLNGKMRMEPIDLQTLKLDKFPELPKPDKVKSPIKRYAGIFFKHNKKDIRRVLRAINDHRRQKEI